MTPVIQSERTECGLACIAMLAEHHGCGIGMRELRQRFPLSLKGAGLARLMKISAELGFQVRPVRVEMEGLGNLSLPCILHWDLDHFVVLGKVRNSRCTILDPSIGKRELAYSEVSRHFTGVALELAPAAGFVARPKPRSLGVMELLGKARGLGAALATVLALSIALQVFVVVAPLYMQWVVDQVLIAADRDLLSVLGIGFALLVLVQVAIGQLRGAAVVFLSAQLGAQWMGNIFSHLLKLPLEYFEKRHQGDVISRMGSVQAIQQTLTTSFVEAIIDGLMAIVTLAMMLVYSWKLTLVALVAVAAYFAVRFLSFRANRDATQRQMIASADQQTYLLETIRGMQSIKISGTEGDREGRYVNLMLRTLNEDVRLARQAVGFASASQAIFGLERVVVVWLGAVAALDGIFSVGMLVAFIAYKEQFSTRLSGLVDKWTGFRMLKLHGERLADIALTEPEENPPATTMVPADADIEVRNLSFRYADDEPWVLRNCSFRIAQGESVAIVGASGCGKTTLVKLMLGLLQPSEGAIYVGGHNIRDVGFRNYRTAVGAVMQDDKLFAGTLAENISFGEVGATDHDVEAAARMASIHDEIAAMPMGYGSSVGDMGSALSGGQKQRLLLARALFRKPRILFLDEATSHLDAKRERLVNEAVQSLNVTKVIVAHRQETIASADRVLRLMGGHALPEKDAPGAARADEAAALLAV